LSWLIVRSSGFMGSFNNIQSRCKSSALIKYYFPARVRPCRRYGSDPVLASIQIDGGAGTGR
jgi:hypothetical protein